MKVLNYYENGRIHVGLLEGNEVGDITEKFETMEAFIAAGAEAKKTAAEFVKSAPKKKIDEIEFAPAVTSPEKIFCIGLNYMSHTEEEQEERPKYPEVFSKYNNALAAHNQKLDIPAAAGQLDYEAELVVVIGKEAKCVSRETAMDYVFGYTIGNDISAREQQFRVTQWLIGKTGDNFAPVGPCIVTKDAIDGSGLDMKLWCNGELRQSDNTANLLFDIPDLVSYLSQYATLKPGDLIFTGTCAGCITGIKLNTGESPWLKSGDEIVIEIEGIGRLKNVIA